MFIVTVNFQIQPGQIDLFMERMQANAAESLKIEAHCLQFDVCVSKADPSHVFLYEVYRSSQDFDDHLKMPHFLGFNAQTASQVINKTVAFFERQSADSSTKCKQSLNC
jgi:quinol monooxygenase YgiN